jgi:hypothetical protein
MFSMTIDQATHRQASATTHFIGISQQNAVNDGLQGKQHSMMLAAAAAVAWQQQ